MKKGSDLRSRPICSILRRLHGLDIWSWSRWKRESISRSCYPIHFPIPAAEDETLPYTSMHLLVGLALSSVIHVMHTSVNGKRTWFIFFLIVSKSMRNSRSPCARIIIINLIFLVCILRHMSACGEPIVPCAGGVPMVKSAPMLVKSAIP